MNLMISFWLICSMETPHKTIQKWKELGITVYHNDKINPFKNMDDWLSLVECLRCCP